MIKFRDWLRECELTESTITYVKKRLKEPDEEYASLEVLTKRQGQIYKYHTDFIKIKDAITALEQIKNYLENSVGRITDIKITFSKSASKYVVKDGYSKNILELK